MYRKVEETWEFCSPNSQVITLHHRGGTQDTDFDKGFTQGNFIFVTGGRFFQNNLVWMKELRPGT